MKLLKSKYEIFDQDMIDRIKLTLAFISNIIYISTIYTYISICMYNLGNNIDNNMHLHEYSKYINKFKKYNTLDSYIKTYSNSTFLKTILHSNKIGNNYI